MAEEPVEKKESAAAPVAEEGGAKKSKLKKLILILGGFVVVQAMVVGVAVMVIKWATNPAPVQAKTETVPVHEEMVLVSVLPKENDGKIRAVNARSGQLVYWSIKVSVRVPSGQAKEITERLIANADLVKQEITTVVAACDPDILQQEADHATLKRQICFALNTILGKQMVSEVVIPECLPAVQN
jgi:flagellar basal body-associated protein FliL